MSRYEEYAREAIRFAHGYSNAGVIYALLALGERMAEFTEFAKKSEERDHQGDLFMGQPDDMIGEEEGDDHK